VPPPSAERSNLRVAGISLDCADPDVLADFYVALLDGERLWSKPSSVGVRAGNLLLVSQRVAHYQPPSRPGNSVVHLDLTAGEHLDEPVARALALGATAAEFQPDPRWRILLDPAGHPFCITTVTAG
jgi:hypothetical protein